MLITDPCALLNYTTACRRWQGIPTVEVTRGGRFFVTFYSGGKTEEPGNYCVLLKSDDGKAFGEPVAAAYSGESQRCYDPCLWLDPRGRLWFTWAQLPDYGVWAAVCDEPDAETLAWSEPVKIGSDVMMNKPVALSDGRILFPIAVWRRGLQHAWLESAAEDRRSFVYESRDGGSTVTLLGGADVPERCFDEHAVVELKDGSLRMLVRTLYGIGQSFSYDGGKTWTPGEDSGLGGPNSRFCFQRTPSGNILLVNHVQNTGRSHLTALLSRDEGRTWEGGLLLDERADVSYPSAAFRDGKIYVVYDRERGAAYNASIPFDSAREILMATFTEEDILAGKPVSGDCRLKQVVSKLPPQKVG